MKPQPINPNTGNLSQRGMRRDQCITTSPFLRPTQILWIEWTSLAKNFDHRNDHVNHRPSRCENNDGERHHFLSPFPFGFDQVLSAQVVASANLPPVIVIVRPGIIPPAIKPRMEKVVRPRKLRAVELEFRFHSV